MSDLAPLFTWRSAIVDSDLGSTTKLVALALSLHMNERGGSCYPSAARLASETSLSVSTVREHRALLELGGWLRCLRRGGLKGESRFASEYEAIFPDPSYTPTRPAPVPVPQTAPTPPGNRADPSGKPTPVLQELSKNTSSRGRRRAKTPIPDDFAPTDATRQWAQETYPEHATKAVLNAFIDHARATDRRQVDWQAALRNWLRNEAKYHSKRAERAEAARTYL